VKYKVHSVHETQVRVAAKTADGLDVEGMLPALVVELVPLDSWGRTYTHVEALKTDEQRTTALATFARDAQVELTVAPVAASPPA